MSRVQELKAELFDIVVQMERLLDAKNRKLQELNEELQKAQEPKPE